MTPKNALVELGSQFDIMQPQIEGLLPKHITYDRFRGVVITAVRTNPKLLSVERRSLFNACLQAAGDGLVPDGREGALVIYRDKKRGEIAQWLIMVAGLRKKVRNSGEIATWEVNVVHENDVFDYELGDEPRIIHRPVRGNRGPIVAAYSVAVLKSGEKSREVMWIDEIHAIRQRSRAGDAGPWLSDFGEMCKKTVAKRHAKVLPMSTDLDDLLRRDDEDNGLEKDEKRALPRPTDALNRIAPLAEQDDVPISEDGEVIEQESPQQETTHG